MRFKFLFIASVIFSITLAACTRTSNQAILLTNEAIKQYNNGHPNSALAILKDAIHEDPSYATAYATMGLIHAKQENPAEAEKAFALAVEFAPDVSKYHDSLGEVLLKQNKYDLAKASFEKALSLVPQFASAHHHLASIYIQQRQWAAADQALRAAIMAEPTAVQPYLDLATLYYDYQYGEQSAQILSNVSKLPISDKAILQKIPFLMARGLYIGQAFEKAIPALKQILVTTPNDGGAYYYLVQSYIYAAQRTNDAAQKENYIKLGHEVQNEFETLKKKGVLDISMLPRSGNFSFDWEVLTR